ncbi:hypothetical protein GMI69_09290 [Eggerthellaceae bacterium zg-887]|uniref:hypothetical protein n=1 Tax=Xiamenia xianingshaonis TaxID=2682776 RepID=UPI001408EF86|nr:hypothetical protein [Xiamenia xianingshaonis]NHM16837.1 hypothetical protein [Xiamenia xianingshaonis]
MAFALACVVFAAPFVDYSCKTVASTLNAAYVVMAVLVGTGLVALVKLPASARLLKRMRTRKAFLLTVGIGSVLLICLQAIIVKTSWFYAGFDVWCVTNYGNVEQTQYFSMNVNQYFMTGLFQRIMGLGLAVGLENGYLCLVAIGCLCVSASVVMAAFIGKRLGGYLVGYAAFFGCFVFVGLSPWILVPYSDTYAMVWTTAVIWFLVCIDNRAAKCLGMAFCSVVAYEIKPTGIFIAAAIVLTALCQLARTLAGGRSLRRQGAHCSNENSVLSWNWRQVVACCLCAALGLGAAFGIASKVKDIGFEGDPEAAFTATHFLMMGFNPETNGIWSGDDVAESQSHATIAERQSANLRIWAQRVQDAGPVGLAKLFVKKTCTNFSDGSMAWTREGDFYFETPNTEGFWVQAYGIGDEDHEAPFVPLFQVVWFVVLIGVAAACFLVRSADVPVRSLCLALFLLCGFVLLFECRARYLILYMPCFVVLAALGWQQLSRRFACPATMS